MPDAEPEDEAGIAGRSSGLARVKGRTAVFSVIGPTNVRIDLASKFIAKTNASIDI
jgi:hypothetical protein